MENRLYRTTFYDNEKDKDGGGSSDFSTAKVTITNNTLNPITFVLPMIIEDIFVAGIDLSESQSTGEIDAVLYKGQCAGAVVDGDYGEATVTGDIIFDDVEGMFIVTGDGTITLSAEK